MEGEIVTGGELKDLNRARAYLRDCANRHGVKVYSDVRSAMDAVLHAVEEARRRKERSKTPRIATLDEESSDFDDPTPMSPKRKMNISRRVSLRCAQRRTHVQREPSAKSHSRNLSIPGALPNSKLDDFLREYGSTLAINGAHRADGNISPRGYRRRPRTPTPGRSSRFDGEVSAPKPTPRVGIFLGGSCNPTTWREDIARPYLDTLGISYYNPQVDIWTSDLIVKETTAKEEAVV